MSRSYKKTPKLKYCGNGKKAKRWANKVVRRERWIGIKKSNHYRKLYETWNITDVRSYLEKPKEKEELELWKKYYYRK